MIEFLIFFTGVFLGLTIFAIFGANKDLTTIEIDRDFYKRLYEEQREALHEAKEKLAQYEDTGLAPDEIKEQIEILKHNYKCMEDTLERQYDNARKLLDELEKDCDYWKREALKWASKLGEQKIEGGKNEGN